MTNPKTNEAESNLAVGGIFFQLFLRLDIIYIVLVRANNIGATCFPQFGK